MRAVTEGSLMDLPDLIFLSKVTPRTSPPCSRMGLSDPRMMLLHSILTAPPSSTSYICTENMRLSLGAFEPHVYGPANAALCANLKVSNLSLFRDTATTAAFS